ncbi:MAG TPA: phosphate/phosphite/phosphonate ABC transporter substrate-binding protein [Bdellovibrionales bacterium]|nr:phosphate/phosphite/phosphonate ABC transporter substrate-binding protein [Bdellovibrionales bacterium]
MKSSKFVFVLVLGLLLGACTKERGELGSEKNPVKFFFVPSVDSKRLLEQAKIVENYLHANTPYKFTVAVPSSYVAVVEAFGTNRADVASLNTFGYIMANEKYGTQARLIVIRNGQDTYQAQIVARADSDIKKLEDINGKKFAFVDPASTSGYLLPAKLFADKNIKPSETMFAQKHDNVIMMIHQKQVDAGATFYSPPEEGKIQDARRLVKTQIPDVEKSIKIVELTEAIPNDPIVFRKDMPEEMKTKIAQALQAFIKTEEGKKAFYESYSITDFKLATDSNYDGVRDMLKKLGKTAGSLMKN